MAAVSSNKSWDIEVWKPNYIDSWGGSGSVVTCSSDSADLSFGDLGSTDSCIRCSVGLIGGSAMTDKFTITVQYEVDPGDYLLGWISPNNVAVRSSKMDGDALTSFPITGEGGCTFNSIGWSTSYSNGVTHRYHILKFTIDPTGSGGDSAFQISYYVTGKVKFGDIEKSDGDCPGAQEKNVTFSAKVPEGAAKWVNNSTGEIVYPGDTYTWAVGGSLDSTEYFTVQFKAGADYKATVKYYESICDDRKGTAEHTLLSTWNYTGSTESFEPLTFKPQTDSLVGYIKDTYWTDRDGKKIYDTTTYKASDSGTVPTYEVYMVYWREYYGPFTFQFNKPSYWSSTFSDTYTSFKVTGTQNNAKINSLITVDTSTGVFEIGPFEYGDHNDYASVTVSWTEGSKTAINKLTATGVTGDLTATFDNAEKFTFSFLPQNLSADLTYDFKYTYGISVAPEYYDYFGDTRLGSGSASTYDINDNGNVTITLTDIPEGRKSTTNPYSTQWDSFKGWSQEPESSVGTIAVSYGTRNYKTALEQSYIIYEAWAVYPSLGPYTVRFELPTLNDVGNTTQVLDTYFKGITNLNIYAFDARGNPISSGVTNISHSFNNINGQDGYDITFTLNKESTSCQVGFNPTLGTLLKTEAVSLSQYTVSKRGATVTISTKTSFEFEFNLTSENDLDAETIGVVATYTTRCFPRVFNYNGTKSSTPEMANQGVATVGPNMSVSFYLPSLTTDSDKGNIICGEHGAPNSRYDSFLGWKLKEEDSDTVAWGRSSAGGKVTCQWSYLDWMEDHKTDGSIYVGIQEVWDICQKLGPYSITLCAPGGLSKVADAYTVLATEITFLNEENEVVNVTHSASSAGENTSKQTFTTTGSNTSKDLNSMVYVNFKITYAPSNFLKAAKTITWNYPNGHAENASEDHVDINMKFSINVLRTNELSSVGEVSATYYYGGSLQCYTYDGTSVLKTLEHRDVKLTNGKLTYSFTAPARQSAADAYPFYWFFKGWDKTAHPEFVADNRTEEQSKADKATYAVNAAVPFEISYNKSNTPTTTFKIYEIFKLGWGYQVIINYITKDASEPDIDKVSLVPKNDTFKQSYAWETEGSQSSVEIELEATGAKKRGYVWTSWEAGKNITSLNGQKCTVNLSGATPSPESSRVRVQQAEVEIKWTPVTWQKKVAYYKNTTKKIENWPSSNNPHEDTYSWTFTKTNAPKTSEDKFYYEYVTKNNEFDIPITLRGTEADYLREDDYQLTEWNEQAIADSDETSTGTPYDLGAAYYLGKWYNSNEKTGTLTKKLYARWVEGTLAYIFYDGAWCRAIPYIYDGGWSKAIIK